MTLALLAIALCWLWFLWRQTDTGNCDSDRDHPWCDFKDSCGGHSFQACNVCQTSSCHQTTHASWHSVCNIFMDGGRFVFIASLNDWLADCWCTTLPSPCPMTLMTGRYRSSATVDYASSAINPFCIITNKYWIFSIRIWIWIIKRQFENSNFV